MGDQQGEPGKNPSDEKEDMLIKWLLKALQDLAEGQKKTREFMGRLRHMLLGIKMVKIRARVATGNH